MRMQSTITEYISGLFDVIRALIVAGNELRRQLPADGYEDTYETRDWFDAVDKAEKLIGYK